MKVRVHSFLDLIIIYSLADSNVIIAIKCQETSFLVTEF